jgi:hypothetical protein
MVQKDYIALLIDGLLCLLIVFCHAIILSNETVIDEERTRRYDFNTWEWLTDSL